MRRIIMFSLSVLLALGMLTLGAVPAQAKAMEMSFTGIETAVSFGVPEREWVADGILHVRGQPVLTTFEGTIAGTPASWENTVVFNLNLNLATVDGTAFLSSVIDLTWGDLRGTFETHATFKITAGAVLLRFGGQGDGDFEGWKIKGTATGIFGSGVLTHEGIILSPHG